MQSLLLDRLVGRITPWEFSTALTESYYTNLRQLDAFPANCHANAAVNSLALDHSGQFLLSGCADSSIKLWDTQPRPVALATVSRRAAHEFGVSSVKWWPHDAGMFVSASFDHTVKVWDTNELEVVHSFDLESRVYSVDICSAASALVAVAADQPFVRLLDLRSSASAHSLAGHKGKTLCVQWHPTNPNLLASGGFDGEVKIWDIRRSRSCLCRLDMHRTSAGASGDNLRLASVKAHSGPVNGLAWHAAGHTLYTTGNDDKVRVWDLVASAAPPINKLVNFGPLTRNKYPQTIPLQLSPANETELQYLLFPSDNDDVFVFRTVDGKLVSRLVRQGEKRTGRTSAMAYMGHWSGTYLCGTMDGEIVAWAPSL
ncbi:Uncharacterized protein ABC855_g1313 [[Candida] zeylanoides]